MKLTQCYENKIYYSYIVKLNIFYINSILINSFTIYKLINQ